MRILLIDPPFYRLFGFYNRYYPLSLVCLGAVLREAGHEVAVYDADFNENPSAMDYARLPYYYRIYLDSFNDPENRIWREVRTTLEKFRPDLLGISMWTTYAAAGFHVAKISKAIDRACPVVVGGPHATVKADEVLSISPSVDYVVAGEGEQTLAELADAIEKDGDFSAVNGLVFRRDGRIVRNPPRATTKDLDTFPLPDRTLLMHEKTYSSEDMGLIMTSRGCPFSCAFCATETKRVRYRSIQSILAEIRHVKATYGTTQFSFKDDSFTVSRKRVLEFCTALRAERLHITWECNTRVDLVDEEMLRQMKRAGCTSIKVGIESGSEEVLARMSKGITLDQVRRAAQMFKKVGIHWTGYFLMGTPGETEKDVYKTLDLMYAIKPDFASIGVYEPFPGTVMFEEGIDREITRADMALAEFYTTLPNDYYRASVGTGVETLDPARFRALESEMKSKFHAYNKNVARVLKRAKARAGLYWHQPATLLSDFRKYISWG